MTILRPATRASAPFRVLGDTSLAAVRALLDEDPIVNAVVAARLAEVGTVQPDRLGGYLVATGGPDRLTGACFAGGNLIALGGSPDEWRALADVVGARPRACSAVVGRADAVATMWQRLERRWGRPRAIRRNQPLLLLDGPVQVEPSPHVGPARLDQLERYLPAAAAMFAEELGVSPHVAPGTAAFRDRMGRLISERRAFAAVDFRGQIVFKAEIGAVTPHTAQIQGVWVRPDLRGRGIGTASLAAVLRHALELAPTASLYVNDFNTAARRMYARLGMRETAVLSTVLVS